MVGLFGGFHFISQPTWQNVRVGDEVALSLDYPQGVLDKLSVSISDYQGILSCDDEVLNVGAINLGDRALVYQEPGEVSLSLRLFGLIPVKQINVAVVPDLTLYPGGQPVGILLRTDGIMVVGKSPVIDTQGKSQFPADDAGIKVGDVIESVNGEPVASDEKMATLIDELGQSGEPITLGFTRKGQAQSEEITPIFCQESGTYRIGLYVRDNAGGVGTLTFIDPVTKRYGALGHMVADNETQQRINILNGKLVNANIEGIKKGQKGYPGEKIGGFVSDLSLGSIEKNTPFGIFGTIKNMSLTKSTLYDQPMPVAFYPEVQLGEAEFLTALDGHKVESFKINIEKISPNDANGKGMVIKITDQALLERTGGIIQGMSGSPIVQNGKIVGAVTHVFINDPTKGYGILIDDMLKEAELLDENGQIKK